MRTWLWIPSTHIKSSMAELTCNSITRMEMGGSPEITSHSVWPISELWVHRETLSENNKRAEWVNPCHLNSQSSLGLWDPTIPNQPYTGFGVQSLRPPCTPPSELFPLQIYELPPNLQTNLLLIRTLCSQSQNRNSKAVPLSLLQSWHLLCLASETLPTVSHSWFVPRPPPAHALRPPG